MNNQASSQRQSLRGAIVSSSELQIAAVFDSKQRAEKMLDIVSNETRVDKSHMHIIDKHDPQFNEKLEKSSSKIGKRLWSSHLALGSIGLGVGMVVAFLLTQFGPALTQQNVMFTYVALISPGIFIGLFVAGLFGLRPDRDHLVQSVKNAVRYGKVALVINIPKSQSSTEVVTLLDQQASKVIESVK